MNVCMLCHFDQREKSHFSKDDISRYRSKRQEKTFRSFSDNRVEAIISFIMQKTRLFLQPHSLGLFLRTRRNVVEVLRRLGIESSKRFPRFLAKEINWLFT